MSSSFEKAPRDEPVAIEVLLSIGLAQFICDVSMVDHPSFNPDDEAHGELVKEFVALKHSIRADIEPFLALSEMVKEMEALLGEEGRKMVDDLINEEAGGSDEECICT